MLLALALLAAAAPDDIVVTGKRVPEPAQIAQVVRAVGAAPVDDQLARWNDPVCVRVLGVAANVAASVGARIEDEARAAGVKVAGAGCRTNVVVSFVRQADVVLRSMTRRQPGLLSGLPLAERAVLLAPDLPVRWWYGYDTRGSDGRAMAMETPALGANASATDAVNLPSRVGDSYHSSLISTKLRVDLTAATVLVDVERATGKKLTAVAAYVARVVLAPTRVTPATNEVETILTLFANAASPPGDLSAFDRAYLSALYRLSADRSAATQRARLGTLIARQLESGQR